MTSDIWRLNPDASQDGSADTALGFCVLESAGDVVQMGFKNNIGWGAAEIYDARIVYFCLETT